MIYAIRQANPPDLRPLMNLRLEAESWLKAANIRQWTEDYAEHGHQVLREAIDHGDAWLISSPNGDPVGTVTLDGPDLDLWDPADDPADALYVYKMIVARPHSGRGLGDAILNWASQRAARAGASWLRLDCRRDNDRLHDYYKARGFELVRTVSQPRRPTNSGALFQRQAGTIVDVDLPDGVERAVLPCHPT